MNSQPTKQPIAFPRSIHRSSTLGHPIPADYCMVSSHVRVSFDLFLLSCISTSKPLSVASRFLANVSSCFHAWPISFLVQVLAYNSLLPHFFPSSLGPPRQRCIHSLIHIIAIYTDLLLTLSRYPSSPIPLLSRRSCCPTFVRNTCLRSETGMRFFCVFVKLLPPYILILCYVVNSMNRYTCT